MKIILTGHTQGLGKHIFDKFNLEHEVHGYSLSTGYDINDEIIQNLIVDKLNHNDIFINNAYSNFAQIDLLYKIFDKYKKSSKIIINISSNSGDGIKKYPHKYAIEKTALDKTCEQLQNCISNLRIINVRFGWLDTNRVRLITDENKIDLDYAVSIIKWLINQPEKVLINNITITPR